jgi:hypothetical protein
VGERESLPTSFAATLLARCPRGGRTSRSTVPAFSVSVLVVGVLTLGGCGGSGGKGGCGANPAGPGCSPTPTLPVRRVITAGSCANIAVNGLCRFPPFTTSQKGDLEITVDWTFAEDSIQLLVSTGTCTLEQINGDQCTYVASTPAATTPKPRVVTVMGLAPGTYQPWVGNRGPRSEAVSILIVLTTGGAAN